MEKVKEKKMYTRGNSKCEIPCIPIDNKVIIKAPIAKSRIILATDNPKHVRYEKFVIIGLGANTKYDLQIGDVVLVERESLVHSMPLPIYGCTNNRDNHYFCVQDFQVTNIIDDTDILKDIVPIIQ